MVGNAQLFKLDVKLRTELEQLLKTASPNELKRYQLFKQLQMESAPYGADRAQRKILEYYRTRYDRRTHQKFYQVFEVYPYPWLMNQFSLDFRSAQISETAVYKLATYLRQWLVLYFSLPVEIVEGKLIHSAVYDLCHPKWYEDATGLGVFDFVNSWRKLVFNKYGDKYDEVFSQIQKEVQIVEASHGIEAPIDKSGGELARTPEQLNLTQTDLYWLRDVAVALSGGSSLPFYPLQRGAKHPDIRILEKVVRTLKFHEVSKKGNPQVLESLRQYLLEKSKALSEIYLERKAG